MNSKFCVKILAAVFCTNLVFNSAYPTSALAETQPVEISINTTSGRKLISPYIYGMTDNVDVSDVTLRSIKQFGAKLSTYNWENNFSNSGSEWFNTSDNSLVSGYNTAEQRNPGLVANSFFNLSKANTIPFTMMTLPMLGFVAADGNGPILENQIAPSERWVKTVPRKESPLSLLPNTEDGTVYIDEYLNHIMNKYGKSTTTGIKGYALDNEPELWSSVHNTAHSEPLTCQEMLEKSISYSSIIKGLDESALVFGGQLSGMHGYLNLNNAADWNNLKGEYTWFIDYYLSEMKKAGIAVNRRLLDVLDVHYYSIDAAEDDKTVVECTDYSHIECNKKRMQSTRTLWDGSYTENSWIGKTCREYIPLLPTLQARISRYYSGTKLSLSAYNFGGGSDISGGIAQVDALGSFANEGVYLACLAPTNQDISYQKSGINIFTNYDGNYSSFGNTLVSSQTSNIENSSVYASISNSNEDALKIVLVNKNYDSKESFKINITSSTAYLGGAIYGFDSTSPEIRSFGNIKNIKENAFTYSMNPRSVVQIVLTKDGKSPEGSITITDNYDNTATPATSEITAPTATETSISETSTDTAASLAPSSTSNITTTSTIIPEEAPEGKKIPIMVKFLTIIMVLLTFCGVFYLIISNFKNIKKNNKIK